ncbi:MAG: hypothetical protein ACK4TA_13080 [Saprospiraceae bacterium]
MPYKPKVINRYPVLAHCKVTAAACEVAFAILKLADANYGAEVVNFIIVAADLYRVDIN